MHKDYLYLTHKDIPLYINTNINYYIDRAVVYRHTIKYGNITKIVESFILSLQYHAQKAKITDKRPNSIIMLILFLPESSCVALYAILRLRCYLGIPRAVKLSLAPLAVVPGGLRGGSGCGMIASMPKSEVQATVRKSAAITNAGNRMEMAEIKKLIHDSGVCLLAIKMAQAGVRPVVDLETGEITEELLSEAAHVDMVKFMVAKVIPNAKEMETTDDIEAHAYWVSVIEADRAKQLASA